MGKKFVEPGRPQITTWHMHIACWIPRATNKLSEYEGGPKNNWNLNVACELEVAARCAARCRESTQ